MVLKFSKANSKLAKLYQVEAIADHLQGRKIYSFDILSGWSCPFAKDCQSRVIVGDDGRRKIQDGPDTQWRCYSSSQEALFPAVYNLRKANFDTLRELQRNRSSVANALLDALPKNAGLIRIHTAGDFFNRDYFAAWTLVAYAMPSVRFYAYTKALPYLANVTIPQNFLLTASRGGTHDSMIGELGIREARVVYSEAEAADLGLPIDSDDSHAATRGGSFALLIHGVQPKGTAAAAALVALTK